MEVKSLAKERVGSQRNGGKYCLETWLKGSSFGTSISIELCVCVCNLPSPAAV